MKYLFILLMFISQSVFSADTSIDLVRVGLADFLRLVYGDALRKNYVLDASAVTDQELFSVTLRNQSPVNLDREIKRILQVRGYKVDDQNGVVIVSRRGVDQDSQAGKDLFFYRPSYRSASYLLSLSESLFKPGSFLGRKQGAIPFTQVSGGVVPGGLNSSLASSMPVQPQGAFDQGANSGTSVDQDLLAFNGSPDDVAKLKKLLAAVDVPAGELLVNAMVLEVQRTARQGSAVDFVTSLIKGKLGLTLSGGAADFASNAKIKFSLDGLDFSAVFAALSSDNRFKVLTSPRVRVRSDATARFTVGNETPVLGSVSYDANGKAIQSVQYKSSGVIFELKPKIRGQVSDLHVSQQISQFVATTNGVNNSPTLTKRELSTDVLVSDGDLILLGGLDETKTTGNRSGVPMFPAFLDAVSEEETKTEIVLLLGIERINRN